MVDAEGILRSACQYRPEAELPEKRRHLEKAIEVTGIRDSQHKVSQMREMEFS
jgi:hypothetical protein